MGQGAMGKGHWAWGKGQWARGIGHGAREKSVLQFPIPNSQLPMPNAQCPIPNSQLPMPNAQCPMPNFHQGVHCRRRGCWANASNSTCCSKFTQISDNFVSEGLQARNSATVESKSNHSPCFAYTEIRSL